MQCSFHEIAAQKIIKHSIGDGGHQTVARRFKCNAAIMRPSEIDRVRLTADTERDKPEHVMQHFFSIEIIIENPLILLSEFV